MKLMLLITIPAYIIFALNAAPLQPASQGPAIAFDRSEYDFGSIMQNEEKSETILLKTLGTSLW